MIKKFYASGKEHFTIFSSNKKIQMWQPRSVKNYSHFFRKNNAIMEHHNREEKKNEIYKAKFIKPNFFRFQLRLKVEIELKKSSKKMMQHLYFIFLQIILIPELAVWCSPQTQPKKSGIGHRAIFLGRYMSKKQCPMLLQPQTL